MTIEQTPIQPPSLGEHGEPCRSCGAPLASDQRYCLECGARRADARVDFMDVLTERIKRESGAAGGGNDGADTAAKPADQPWWRSPYAAAGAGVALLAVILGVGVLIGSSGDSGKQVAQTPPQIIRVESGGTPATPQAAFTADWPEGQDGFTIQLQTLPKSTTQVTAVVAAKTDATSKGAPDVGALDSSQFSGMDPDNYVIYSGQFDTRKRAEKALKPLKASFPQATVIEVGGGSSVAGGGDPNALSGHAKKAKVDKGQLESLQKLSPDQYQKKSQKLPDTTELPGKAPPKDNQKPGGGGGDGGGQVIK